MTNLKELAEKKLSAAGVQFEFISLPDNLAIDVLSHVKFHGITLAEAIPTLVYKTEKGFIAVQKRADTRIDAKKLKELVGIKRLGLATEEELHELGAIAGAVPLTGLETPYFIDKKVLEKNIIYGGGGNKSFALKMHAKDLVYINNAVVGEISELSAPEQGAKKRILTGDRPTGKLHLGHYVGSLKNRARLQDEYDQFVLVADVQALTDNFENPQKVRDNIKELVLDYIAVGIDPSKSTILIQSMIPEIAELTVYYLDLVTLERVLRNPTVKDEIKQKGFGKNIPAGFAMYPVSQAADITAFQASLVPVGEDQLPMIEQTREIVRKFNTLYGNILVEPEALLGEMPRLPGTDGQAKMGKSLGNCIYLSDNKETIDRKVMAMYTDPSRVHPSDPGNPENNPVFIYHRTFNQNKDEVAEFEERYKVGKIGDVEVKKRLVEVINNLLAPMRERRAVYETKPEEIEKILKEGTDKAREVAIKTMKEVRRAMKIDYFT